MRIRSAFIGVITIIIVQSRRRPQTWLCQLLPTVKRTIGFTMGCSQQMNESATGNVVDVLLAFAFITVAYGVQISERK